jgi:tetratricopeptide (TPR) repeat protein
MRLSLPTVVRAATREQRLVAIEEVLENVRIIERKWPAAKRVFSASCTEAADLLLENKIPNVALTYIHKGQAVAQDGEAARLLAREAAAEGMLGNFQAAADAMDRALKHNSFAALSDAEQLKVLRSAADIRVMNGDLKGSAKIYREIARTATHDEERLLFAMMAARRSIAAKDEVEGPADLDELDRAVATARRNGVVTARMIGNYEHESAVLHKKAGH